MPRPSFPLGVAHAAGAFLIRKARQQQATSGTQRAARNLRKQGVPLDIALRILAR